MKREWKTGDVAMVTRLGERVPAIRRDDGWWCTQYGNALYDDEPGTRPLVVIDAEDREQVERLIAAYSSQPRWHTGYTRDRVDDMQAALREFANPKPPPKCPASLAIGGEVLRCERDPGHVTDHRNDSIGQGVRWSS